MALWTPAGIATALWLDAADSSTLFDSVSGGSLPGNGVGVARWEDKSGNGRHVTQATSGNRPTRSVAGQNGLDVLSFDGVNDLLLGDLAETISQPLSLFCVTRKNGDYSAFNSRVFHASTSAGSETNIFLPLAAITTGNFVWNFGTDTNTTTAFGSAWAMYETIANSTSSLIRRDASSVVTGNPGTNGCGRYFSVGGRYHDGLRNYNGDISELLLVAGSLSTSERQIVEGYIAHKWGIQSSLPSDHPYKNGPPVKGGLSTIVASHYAALGI